MTRQQVPQHPAYVVCHDHYDGTMEVWPADSLPEAESKAFDYQRRLDACGEDYCHFAAYAKLPNRPIYKFHLPR